TLLARGLHGVKLVISDAHAGLKKAISEIFLGASWQRCKVHFMRNVENAVPSKHKKAVGIALSKLFTLDTRAEMLAHVDTMVAEFGKSAPNAMNILVDGIEDAMSYLNFPPVHAAKISSTNPIERVNREIRRRTRVVGVFPSLDSAMRLIAMVILHQTEDWEGQRGYMSTESMQQILAMQERE